MDLKTVLKNAKFALSKDLTRTSLCGVYFDKKEHHYNIVATDGHLLYKYCMAHDDVRHGFLLMGLLDLMPDENFIFYGDEKLRTKGELKIFDTDNIYPKYETVIPSPENGTPINSAQFYVAFDPERHVQVKKILKSHSMPSPMLGIRNLTTKVGPAWTDIDCGFEDRSLVLLMPLRMSEDGN